MLFKVSVAGSATGSLIRNSGLQPPKNSMFDGVYMLTSMVSKWSEVLDLKPSRRRGLQPPFDFGLDQFVRQSALGIKRQ